MTKALVLLGGVPSARDCYLEGVKPDNAKSVSARDHE